MKTEGEFGAARIKKEGSTTKRKTPSLTEQLKAARERNKELQEKNNLLQENLQWHLDRQKTVSEVAQKVEEQSNPPTLLECLATVDLSIFDEATAGLIQRLQKRLAVL